MERKKIKWKYVSVPLIVLSLVIALLIYRNQESSNLLIFEGSTSYIKKTDIQKKQLTIGVMNPPQESRSYLGQDQTARLTARLVYEPLVYIKKDLSIELMLADKIQFSDNGLEAKIKLNKDAQFSNGELIDAKTIKETYLSLNKAGSQYSQKELCQNIQGIEEYQSGKSQDISGIIINSDDEITFQFKNSSVVNIQSLSVPIFKTIENSQWAIGTGEYAFENYTHNRSIGLKKNANRHTSKYKFDKIMIKGISTIGMKADIDKFNLDVCEVTLTSDMKDIKEAKYHNIYEVNQAYHLNYLEFNLADQAGANKNLRKAISYGINKQGLKKGFDKNERINHYQLSSLYKGKSTDTYNLDKAKQAYQEAHKIKDIEYYTLGDTVSALRYDEISQNLKQLGINLKKTSNKNATLQYTTQQMTIPINQFENNIMNSSLKTEYQEFIQAAYQKEPQEILKSLEDYCREEYMTIPISTVAYGLAISSDVDQENVRDLMINS